MKTLSFKNLSKYVLLTVMIITAFLAAFFIFKPKRSASAEETATIATGDFIQQEVVCSVKTGTTDLKFEAPITINNNSDLYNTVTHGRNESTVIQGDETVTTLTEYYVATIFTTDLTSYYNCLEYELINTNLDGKTKPTLNEISALFANSTVMIATPTTNDFTNSNSLGATYNQILEYNGNSSFKYDSINKNGSYYAYSVVIKYVNKYTDRLLVDTDSHQIYITNKTDSYVTVNERELVKSKLINATSKNVKLFTACQTYLGIYAGADANTTVNVNYILMKDYALFENKTISFNIESICATSPKLIESELYNVLAAQGFDDITDFNAKYVDYEYVENDKLITGERIIRQATSLDIQPDFTQTKTATVNVVYSDFEYIDLALYVSNNGFNIDTELLKMPVYTTDVEFISSSNIYKITFNFSNVEQQLYTTCKWLFDLTPSNINVTGANDRVNVTVNESALIITFNADNEEYLFGLSLQANAEIVEDYELTYTYVYAELDDDLNETLITSSPVTLMYSDFVKLINAYNFYTKHGNVIDEAISPSVLNGAKYYTYDNINVVNNKAAKTAEVTVEYAYNTMFKLISSSGEIHYVTLNKNSLNYTFNELNFTVPSGYRVSKISRGNSDINVAFNVKDPYGAKITVNVATNLKLLIPIYVEVTDTWLVNINYLTRYKQTPFAEYLTTEKEVKVADYENSIYEWGTQEVSSVLGVSNLNVLESTPSMFKVSFDNVSTYTIDIEYTKTTLVQIDYDKNRCELQIPLTSFADWCDFYKKDWTIKFLNGLSANEKYFTYVNDIDPSKLYGYFSVAVFEEKVKDFNYYFANNTSSGCMCLYNSVEVAGSDIYQFFGGLRNSVLGVSAHVGMALCEILDDNNKMYHSYFFYLNGNSDSAFISNSGADNAFDDDSAFDNTAEDVNAFLGTQFNSFNEWWENSGIGQTLQILLYVAIGIAGLAFLIWLLKVLKVIK